MNPCCLLLLMMFCCKKDRGCGCHRRPCEKDCGCNVIEPRPSFPIYPDTKPCGCDDNRMMN